MMNLGFVANIPSRTAVAEALSLVGDPPAIAKLMEDLTNAHTRAVRAHEEATKLRAELVEERAAHERDKQQFADHKAAQSEFLRQSAATADQRETERLRAHQSKSDALAVREQALADALAAHDVRARAFLDKVKAITNEARSLVSA
jgi:hypothetical protein